jgi:hypothetical protein
VVRAGSAVTGAHVVAFDLATGALVGTFSLASDGGFTLAGLAPGPKVLRVEPVDDAALTSFSLPPGSDAAFAPAYHDELVIVPAGGSAGPVTLEVRSR